MIEISIVVPVFNEEDNVIKFVKKIKSLIKDKKYEIIFCLDPSNDNSEKNIRKVCKENKNIKCLIFSRRFGQPSAIIAGINNCIGKTCVIMDIDFQDPPELINQMYDYYLKGYNVVLAKRKSRKNESLIKIFTSKLAYKLIHYFSDNSIPKDIGDFRLIDRKIINHLKKFNEKNIYLKGLVSYIGFKQKIIEFDRRERKYGYSKFKHYGSFSIFFSGLFGFSSKPLNILLFSGVILSFLSIFMLLLVIISKFILNVNFPVGTPTIIISIFFFSGIQLISIGILGQYIGRIFDEVKKRPLYIIKDNINIKVNSER